MVDSLADRVYRLEDAFFAALKDGPAAVAKFNAHYVSVFREVERASNQGTLPDYVGRSMHSVSVTIMEHAQTLRSLDGVLEEAVQSSSSDSSDAALEHPSSPRASLPLFRYFLDNICSPYPELDEKEHVVEAVRELGWRDFDKKKFEDWLNRRRVQSGFVAILRGYCDGDHDSMRRLCRAALHGSDEDKAHLPDGALDDIEDMRDLIQSQHDELLEETDTAWVDELATSVRAVMTEDTSPDDHRCSTSDVDDSDLDSDSDSASDAASNWSETDVEDDEYEDEESPCAIIGAKRKLTDSSDSSPSIISPPLSRSLSLASSADSSSTACSPRSFSGCSISNATSVEWEDEDSMCDRPAKRRRNDSWSFDTVSMSTGAHTGALSNDPLFTTYQIKSKRVNADINSRARSMKRSRYAALGVASQANNVLDVHLPRLSELCTFDWTPVEVVACDLVADSFTVDCTQSDDETSEDEDPAIFDRDEALQDDILTWSKLQIFAIARILLSASDQLPVSLAQSATYAYAFDIETLGADNGTNLEEMMRLTPEALSAMFDAMNGLVPAPFPAEEAVVPVADTMVSAEETVVSAEETVVSAEEIVPAGTVIASSGDALSPEAPILSQDDSARAPNVPSPVLDVSGLAHDVFVAAVETPILRIDTSPSALEAPASQTEEPLDTPEELLSPTSSSSSEGDSPPALSDDSGSSSRSSSVESDSEQDSLLLSPAALSADYIRLNDELSTGKTSNADPSHLEVELGAVPEVTTADELSCASELLERYLNDQMTWA